MPNKRGEAQKLPSGEELQDVLYDYELCRKELRRYRQKYDTISRPIPSRKDGEYLCPECKSRINPWRSFCSHCGNRIGE